MRPTTQEILDGLIDLQMIVKSPEWHGILKSAQDEIERLQAAKRAALRVADERSKENAELRAALERMKWKPIETNGFMSAKRYLVVEANGLAIPFIGFRIYENGPWLSDSGSEAQEVWPTHWMDLPEA